MKEFKGTPGQWIMEHNGHYVEVKSDARLFYNIASGCYSDVNSPDNIKEAWPEINEAYSNFRLIAAAPDLLFALQEITAHLDSIKQYANDDYYINQAQLAITKALGE